MAEVGSFGDVAVTPRGTLPSVSFKLDGPMIIRADSEVAEVIDQNGVVRVTFYLKRRDD